MQPETNARTCDVLVVGTGIAALAAGERLRAAGRDVVLVDKARGVGGRLATRRLAEGNCDHGVPSFRVEGEDFRHATLPWLKEGVAKTWARLASGASPLPTPAATELVGVPGMTALAKAMAKSLPAVDLDVKLDRVAVRDHGKGWIAEGSGRRYASRAILLSPPVPQTLALLDAGAVGLALSDRATLQAVRYWPTFVVLARFAGEPALPPPGWLGFEKDPRLSAIVDDRRKGASPVSTATIRSTYEYAERHFDRPDEAVLAELLAAAAPHLSGPPVETELHRWRFATVREGAAAPWLLLKGTPPAYCIGDAFGGGTVEGAWRSGRAAAEHLLAEEKAP
jgi:predicted NAD/FAD-dependent oxidoreductase